ncbi:ABC transporter substrate-binding protein [Eggerthella lenta]|uniref:extracellular solute-binding protein n=1 Tax=Eggerthella lenta TaxID=84112 RepID=UPI000DF8071F|nr:extracellular solute-binding protein [Eggerthella lenta]RDB94798.1 ABC transporter substrate-binding protein [Eggerthella lenta]
MKALKRAGKAAKTFASIVLAGSLVGIGLVGCSGEAMGNASGRDDEIVLTVSKCQTKELPQELLDEMTNRHPNLRFEFDTYSNSNYSAQIVTELEQRDIPDILINTRNQDLTEDLEHNLVDLAAYDFSSEYLPSVLDRMTIDGSLYYLPGYLTLAGFFYNKDLFAEHGWEAPQSLEELIALNEQAKAEGIRLMAYSMELTGQRFLQLTNIASAQFLHTPQGSSWEQDYLAGEASMVGTFEPFMDEYRLWLDSGLISADDLSLSNSDAAEMFANGDVAMIYGVANNVKTTDFDFDLGQAPFLARGEGEDNGWYLYAVSSYYGINKKLEEPGNEEKLAIALEMFDLMSTPEGQSMFTDGAEGRYPAMRKADGELHAPLLSDYRNVVDRNNLVELAAYTAPLLLGGEALGGYIAGTVSAEEALQACDEAMKSNKSETQIGDVVAHIERDLSRETVRYFADAFREYGGTDLCLMLPGGMADGQMHPYGISGKLYEGELHANELTVLLPNAGKPVPTLATARISGEDLRAVLESGRAFERKDASREALAPFRYEVSGAEVDYDADRKVRSLKVNGVEVADEDVFTVTYFDGAVETSRLTDAAVSDVKPVPAFTACKAAR